MDVVGKWKLWMAISFVPIAIGTIFIAANGLNLGLDFERHAGGGPVRAARHRGRRAPVTQELGLPDAKIQATSEEIDGQRIDGFQVQTETLQPDQLQELRRGLDAEYGLEGGDFQSVDTVGPVLESRSSATRSGRSCSASR